MIKILNIKNFALIKDITIEFDKGLNILTGETGAGKSVIVDAIMVLLGERSSVEFIRKGEKKAIIEGVFNIKNIKPVIDILQKNEYYYDDDDIIIRREILEKGSSRSFINDSPVSVALLRYIGDYLVDFHGQHDHQLLIKPENHIDILDIVTSLNNLKNEYSLKYNLLKDICDNYKKTLENEKSLKQKKDIYQFELQSIKNINPKFNELENLENELKILQNVESIHKLSNELYSTFYSDDNQIRKNLISAKKILEQLAKIDNNFNSYLGEFESALITIDEVSKYAQNYAYNIEFDENKIENIRQRIYLLNGLKKKYGSYEAIFDRIKFLENELSVIDNFNDELNRLQKDIISIKKELGVLAEKISFFRKESSKDFSLNIKKLLSELGMPNAEFEIKFFKEIAESNDLSDLNVTIDGIKYKIYQNGYDKVEFYISTNKGENPKPLALVASGGEISRIMLAIKSIVADADNLPILVFDEIDTGISGRIAQKVGLAMKQLAQKHQIIAITHLPQIAAKGDRNFVVKKVEENNNTLIYCNLLSQQDKINEIAKLISGEIVTDKAIESAKELLK